MRVWTIRIAHRGASRRSSFARAVLTLGALACLSRRGAVHQLNGHGRVIGTHRFEAIAVMASEGLLVQVACRAPGVSESGISPGGAEVNTLLLSRACGALIQPR